MVVGRTEETKILIFRHNINILISGRDCQSVRSAEVIVQKRGGKSDGRYLKIKVEKMKVLPACTPWSAAPLTNLVHLGHWKPLEENRLTRVDFKKTSH